MDVVPTPVQASELRLLAVEGMVSVFNAEQPFIILPVLLDGMVNLLRSRLVKPEQPLNISCILVTLAVLKLLKLRLVNLGQL